VLAGFILVGQRSTGVRPGSRDIDIRKPRVAPVLQDIRFALRSFNRHRGYAATAMLTVALGIGANTAVFSLADSVLFRPLPFAAAERLLVLRIGDVKTKQTYGFVPQSAVESVRASRFVDGIGAAEPRQREQIGNAPGPMCPAWRRFLGSHTARFRSSGERSRSFGIASSSGFAGSRQSIARGSANS
jgi:hypothetical protein